MCSFQQMFDNYKSIEWKSAKNSVRFTRSHRIAYREKLNLRKHQGVSLATDKEKPLSIHIVYRKFKCSYPCLNLCLQHPITSGRSRIFPRGKSAIIFQFFCRKLHEKEGIWTGGPRVPGAPPSSWIRQR